MAKVEARIPFMGFYETIHSDKVCEHLLTVNGCEDPEHNTEKFHETEDCDPDRCSPKTEDGDYKKAEIEYCRGYVRAFSKRFGIPLEYVDMTSPREYNFQTDRIFAMIDEEDVERLKKRVDPVKIREYVKRHFTSYSGFSSFYDNDYDRWLTQVDDQVREKGCEYMNHYVGNCKCLRPPKPFDHNQICALLECVAEDEDGDSWEFDLCCDLEF